MNDAPMMTSRTPVSVSMPQGTIVTTGGTASFKPNNADDALEQYLRLVRKMRSQQRDKDVSIRRRDIDALAIDLNLDSDEVVRRLCDLMGSTRSQRLVVSSTLAAGAAVLLLAGSAAAFNAAGEGAISSTSAPTGSTIVGATTEPGSSTPATSIGSSSTTASTDVSIPASTAFVDPAGTTPTTDPTAPGDTDGETFDHGGVLQPNGDVVPSFPSSGEPGVATVDEEGSLDVVSVGEAPPLPAP